MPDQIETKLKSEDVLRLYAEGEREFVDLNFLNYLQLDNCELSGIKFYRCWLDGSFCDSNLEASEFTGSCIKTVDFHRANLRNSDFRCANIDATEFDGANLDGADFEGATAHCHTFGKDELPEA